MVLREFCLKTMYCWPGSEAPEPAESSALKRTQASIAQAGGLKLRGVGDFNEPIRFHRNLKACPTLPGMVAVAPPISTPLKVPARSLAFPSPGHHTDQAKRHRRGGHRSYYRGGGIVYNPASVPPGNKPGVEHLAESSRNAASAHQSGTADPRPEQTPGSFLGSPLFGSFIGTTAQSDSSVPFAPVIRQFAFSGRSAPLPQPDSSEVSRFSYMKFPSVPGSTTTQGSWHPRACACLDVAFPFTQQGRRPGLCFRSSIPCPPVPLFTLHALPRGSVCETRGQDGSLLLSCETLSFSTSCRFIPALWVSRLFSVVLVVLVQKMYCT